MTSLFNKHKLQLKIIFVFIIIALIVLSIFYPLIPSMLNFPNNGYNNAFQWELEHTNYNIQFIEIGFALIIIYSILVFIKLSFLNKLDLAVNNNDEILLVSIRNKLFNVPDELYLMQILIPSIGVLLLYAFLSNLIGIALLKVFIMYTSLIIIIATFSTLYVRREFAKLLSIIDLPAKSFEKMTSLVSRMRYQIIPLVIVALMLTSLLGYSISISKNSDLTYELYKTKLDAALTKTSYDSMDSIISSLKNLESKSTDKVFILSSDKKFYDINKNTIEFSDFWKKYVEEISIPNQSMIYDSYGLDIRGIIKAVPLEENIIYVGVQYNLGSRESLIVLGVSMIVLLLVNLFTLHIASKSISDEVTSVSKGMEKFLVNPMTNNNIPITSNDEIGELIVSFNKVQELTNENIKEIKNNEQILMEKERLASLGELIGGIAHNMKTPILSTAGAAEGLIELIAEYRASIDNPQVTSDDHKEIADDMLDWVTRIKSYNSYMSDIISAVKGQASQLASNDNEKFTLYDVSKRVEILIQHEIKKANLTLNTEIKCDPSITLNGDINSLIQVIDNLISNSIFAYEGEPNKEIKYIIDADDQNVIMQVIDEGCGMDEETKSKLFKQMYTTKGINGTGLGLYMSYSTIRGNFNGTMSFESEEGQGSTFTVTIPRR